VLTILYMLIEAFAQHLNSESNPLGFSDIAKLQRQALCYLDWRNCCFLTTMCKTMTAPRPSNGHSRNEWPISSHRELRMCTGARWLLQIVYKIVHIRVATGDHELSSLQRGRREDTESFPQCVHKRPHIVPYCM
jgi:hypothetical protein